MRDDGGHAAILPTSATRIRVALLELEDGTALLSGLGLDREATTAQVAEVLAALVTRPGDAGAAG